MKRNPRRAKKLKARLIEKRERLQGLYLNLELSREEYVAERNRLQAELDKLKVPEAVPLIHVAELMVDLPELWDAASAVEKRDLIRLMFQVVYVDTESRRITGVRPKPAFLPLIGFCGALEETRTFSEWQESQ